MPVKSETFKNKSISACFRADNAEPRVKLKGSITEQYVH